MKRGTLNLMKSLNNKAVWKYLTECGQASITEISKAVKLTFPTVNRAVEDGLNSGIIAEGIINNSVVGRKPQLYAINRDFARILCVLIDNDEIHYQLRDFCGDVIYKGKESEPKTGLLEGAAQLINRISQTAGQIDFVSLSLTGIIDSSKVVMSYKYPELNGVNIAEEIQRRSGVSTVVENNMKLLGYTIVNTLGEDETKNVSIIQYGHNGFGCCSIIRGHILRGLGGFAGEIGYLPFGERNLKDVDIYSKVIESVVSVVAPRRLIIYNDESIMRTQLVLDTVKERLPAFVIPQVISNRDFYTDQMQGLFIMSRNRIMDSFFNKEQ